MLFGVKLCVCFPVDTCSVLLCLILSFIVGYLYSRVFTVNVPATEPLGDVPFVLYVQTKSIIESFFCVFVVVKRLLFLSISKCYVLLVLTVNISSIYRV